ncbi:UDP-N-acetylglucosamine 4,6-dehydratase (inverting) [Oleidesulfovibrio sp.]|uniref:UDP-N-acetylglucosamine 4,6-dehydratase (inverting) n=1 Tax=Oleidesulfovibrio sp. TaxID=2909707 RepID=UPI003A83D0A7
MFTDKTILITGGTGSFGQQCIRMLFERWAPKKVIVFSRDEMKQWDMQQAFPKEQFPALRFFVGDVRDKERLYRAMRGVDILIHAAALKIVPTAEYNPFEAIRTNIIGTENVVSTALDCGVKKAVMLSTDKAVSPANLYGATKLCAEKMFVAGNAYSGESGTRFCAVRYGNVVGSRGSVVPLFLKQREKGLITITDSRMTRFWITLRQGVDFVLSSLEMSVAGEIFVPKLPTMHITDLAKAICPDCEVKFTGIRPGEKLHETMLSVDEARHTQEQKDRFIIKPLFSFSTPGKTDWGTPVPEGFEYNSESNPWKLDEEELTRMLIELDPCYNGPK